MEDNLKIIEENISLLSDKSEKLSRIKSAMYREAALAMNTSEDVATLDDALRIFERICGNNLTDCDFSDLATFSREISLVCNDKFGRLPCNSSTPSRAVIAYMQNSYSDIAFLKFASILGSCGAVYFPGFREVCEEVYYERCTHAIVPVYTSKDGQLLSFRRLISKYELKIAIECDVDMNDESVMRFALLQKGISKSADSKYIDLSVILPDYITTGKFISAVESLGAKMIMTGSVPLDYSDDKYSLDFIFETESSNINALYLFLELSQISYEIIGVYSVLS